MKKLSFILLCFLLIGSIVPAFSADTQQNPTYQININSDPNSKNSEPINLRFLNDGNYRLSWKIKDKIIEISISAKTTGWVAIGFDPSIRMKDADVYFGFVDQAGKGQAFDMYSTGEMGPHPSDTDLGGKNDLISPTVTLINGWTTFSFQRKLDTGDRFDKPILFDKPMKVLWSVGIQKNTKEYHAIRGFTTINFTKPDHSVSLPEDTKLPIKDQPNSEIKSPRVQTVLKFHIFFMILGFLLLLATISMIYSFKRKTWWFQFHRIFGFISFAFIITAFCFAIKLASLISKGHFNVLHGIVGLVAIEVTIVLSVISILYLFAKKHQKFSLLKKLRILHIWIARILVVMFISNAYLGILLSKLFYK